MIQELQELFGKSLVKSYTLIKRDKKKNGGLVLIPYSLNSGT